ncbi:uncharacterized protein LOC143647089 isoform X1 [Tamandua tetradactyla]|uniref:uncharacterized protein LOC143647089 isoform X1 n=1 Tax=Tamandua tetradactyla TaxID=48850 RepID=UPI004053EE2B
MEPSTLSQMEYRNYTPQKPNMEYRWNPPHAPPGGIKMDTFPPSHMEYRFKRTHRSKSKKSMETFPLSQMEYRCNITDSPRENKDEPLHTAPHGIHKEPNHCPNRCNTYATLLTPSLEYRWKLPVHPTKWNTDGTHPTDPDGIHMEPYPKPQMEYRWNPHRALTKWNTDATLKTTLMEYKWNPPYHTRWNTGGNLPKTPDGIQMEFTPLIHQMEYATGLMEYRWNPHHRIRWNTVGTSTTAPYGIQTESSQPPHMEYKWNPSHHPTKCNTDVISPRHHQMEYRWNPSHQHRWNTDEDLHCPRWNSNTTLAKAPPDGIKMDTSQSPHME